MKTMRSTLAVIRTAALSATLTAIVAVAAPLMAAELETEWIEPDEGFTESRLGVRVHDIEELPDDAGRKITVEIPRESLQHRTDIPEIVITARRADRSERQLEIPHAWLADYDNDHYGLVLYLGRNQNLPFRLFLKTDE